MRREGMNKEREEGDTGSKGMKNGTRERKSKETSPGGT